MSIFPLIDISAFSSHVSRFLHIFLIFTHYFIASYIVFIYLHHSKSTKTTNMVCYFLQARVLYFFIYFFPWYNPLLVIFIVTHYNDHMYIWYNQSICLENASWVDANKKFGVWFSSSHHVHRNLPLSINLNYYDFYLFVLFLDFVFVCAFMCVCLLWSMLWCVCACLCCFIMVYISLSSSIIIIVVLSIFFCFSFSQLLPFHWVASWQCVVYVLF